MQNCAKLGQCKNECGPPCSGTEKGKMKDVHSRQKLGLPIRES